MKRKGVMAYLAWNEMTMMHVLHIARWVLLARLWDSVYIIIKIDKFSGYSPLLM